MNIIEEVKFVWKYEPQRAFRWTVNSVIFGIVLYAVLCAIDFVR
jgi:hypothetical protein